MNNIYSIEKGVLENSDTFFHTPSNLSKSLFFYLLCTGHFYCDKNYCVNRENHDSFLIMYIKDGEGTVQYDNNTYNVKTNDLVLLNCRKHHIYKTEKWETLWLHFNGNVSDEYFQLLYNRFGCVISLQNSTIIPEYLTMILNSFKDNSLINEPLISCHIQRILTELMIISTTFSNDNFDKSNPILESISFIQNNHTKKITLNDIAAHVCMSPFYFSRVFKKETGYAPYEYITMIRLKHAKNLLKTTNLHVKEIAFSVGFNSETNFVTCFKEHENVTPSKFRNTSF